eukprot:3933868-Rhodomonas_salina.2
MMPVQQPEKCSLIRPGGAAAIVRRSRPRSEAPPRPRRAAARRPGTGAAADSEQGQPIVTGWAQAAEAVSVIASVGYQSVTVCELSLSQAESVYHLGIPTTQLVLVVVLLLVLVLQVRISLPVISGFE